jgi:CubicO group peptidase (beta-lactamase class C family)
MTSKPFVFLALLGLSAAALAQAPQQSQIDALMSRYTGDVPGASLLVVKDGKAVFERG